jgi:hypothetical protein
MGNLLFWLGIGAAQKGAGSKLDCPAIDRGIRVAAGAAIYHSRPGLRLWRRLPPSASSDGHTRSTDRTTLTMAE